MVMTGKRGQKTFVSHNADPPLLPPAIPSCQRVSIDGAKPEPLAEAA